jgi:dTDP-3-amino-3,4,6-trideoxy-alpha-D-glucose transaminase
MLTQTRTADRGHIGLRARATLDESPEGLRQVRLAIARAKEGDRDALRLLYVRYSDNIYGYVRSIVRDEKEAEDLTQHVFLKLITAGWPATPPSTTSAAAAPPPPKRSTAPTSTSTPTPSTAPAISTPRSTPSPRSSAASSSCATSSASPHPRSLSAWVARRAPSTVSTTAVVAPCSRSCGAWTARPPPPSPPEPAMPGVTVADEPLTAVRPAPAAPAGGQLTLVASPPGKESPMPQTQVPFTRMDCADPALLEELLGVVREVAERGAFTLGHHVEDFERDFAAHCETDFAIGVSSGTDALSLALRALEIGPGDEVILPTNSFIATAEAVTAVGATPRLVDVDPDSHLITADHVAAALGPRVRCVIPVHLYGATVDLDPILALAHDAGIHVLEDACQAHGARYRGRRAGTLGALGCFSFYPAKNLGAWGDGGAVVTASPELADRVRLLRSHGERPRYHHRVAGSTARLDALQAAILRRKLTRLDGWSDERRRLGAALRQRLTGGGTTASTPSQAPPGIGAEGSVTVDPVRLPFPDADHVYHLFVVRSDRRDALREHLVGEGVASAIHYPVPIHATGAYAELDSGSLPVAESLAGQICSLPVFPGMTQAELDQIVSAVEKFTKGETSAPR